MLKNKRSIAYTVYTKTYIIFNKTNKMSKWTSHLSYYPHFVC